VLRCALLVILALMLAGCGGASRVTRTTGATLAADISRDGGFFAETGDFNASCATRHTCALTYDDRVFGRWPNWIGVRTQVWSMDNDERYASVRHLRITVIDRHSGRVAAFACVLRHKDLYRKGSFSDNAVGLRDYCVERIQKLTS
jgi:hypothetical protein